MLNNIPNKSYFEYFDGKAKWVKAITPDPKFKTWNYQHYPTDESLSKFKKLQEEGVLTTLKKDDDGYYFQLKRPTSKVMRGELVAFAPPKILDKDGNVLDGVVGNGSDVTSKVQVYQYNKPSGGKGKAIRWEAMKVLNLIPFKAVDFEDAESVQQVSGLTEHPEPVW